MSNLPKPQEITLTAEQHISDSLSTLLYGHSLIQGGTGMGKSTFVMEYLAQNNQIVMLCPLVSQVEQLQQIYGHDDGYVFIHGTQSISKNEIPAVIRKHLVMTYDQFSKLEPHLSSKAIIVVDEVQKLYSVGTYREKPIQFILEVAKKQKFDRIVFLTATLTSHLFEKLNIQISHYYKFTKTSGYQRSITIINPTAPNPRYWVWDVLKRLKHLREEQSQKVIVIRVNDIEIAKQVKEIYKTEGFNIQLINSKEISNPSCKELLSLERINTEYDAVICTSILDEAINLKNHDDEIDSIHIIGGSAHPEEIVQFIGRLRVANPPVYIHLPMPINNSKINFVSQHEKYVCQNEVTYHEVCAFLNDIKVFLNVERFKGFEEIISTKIDKTKIMNGLTNELINCKGFWSDNTTIGLNIASIVARFYRLDTQQCYSNINYLKQRLLQFLSDAHVTIIKNDSPLPQAMEDAFQQSENSLEEQRKDAVIKVRRSLLLTLHKVKTFKEFKKKIDHLPIHESPEFEEDENPTRTEVYEEAMELSERLDNLKDVCLAIKRDHTNKIIQISHDYQSNPIVISVMQQLLTAYQRKEFKKQKHSYDEITQLMNKGLQKIADKKSIMEALKHYPDKYIEITPENSLQFKAGKSILFLQKYCFIHVFNAKKPSSLKKVQFRGLTAFGYGFNEFPVRSKKTMRLNDTRYNARTGQLVEE
ncbi:hypothetical protein [Acinetobacter baumannii]|uniref:hypothetical protein n=1 Tax=Acinetobacter baumannii TaxID=470 RepID=UPI003891F2F8